MFDINEILILQYKITLGNQQEKKENFIKKWVQFKYRQYKEGEILVAIKWMKIWLISIIVSKAQVNTLIK